MARPQKIMAQRQINPGATIVDHSNVCRKFFTQLIIISSFHYTLVFLGLPLSITMTKFTVTSKPTTMQTAPSRMTVKKVHQKSYWQYDTAYLFDSLIKFACLTDGISIRAFLKSKENLAKSSFLHYFKQSGLADLKSNGPFDRDIGKVMLTKYFEQTFKNCAKRTAEAHGSCHYLMDHEEHAVVQLCSFGLNGLWHYP